MAGKDVQVSESRGLSVLDHGRNTGRDGPYQQSTPTKT